MMFWSRRHRRLYTARARSEQLRALVALWSVILLFCDYGAETRQERGYCRDEVACGEGGDDGAFADAFDAAGEGERANDGEAYEGYVEAYFEASEFAAVASRGVFDESFGTHDGYVGFKFEDDAKGLAEAAESECGKSPEVVRRGHVGRERHVEVYECREDE